MVNIHNVSCPVGLPQNFEHRKSDIEHFFKALAGEANKLRGSCLPLPGDRYPDIYLVSEEDFVDESRRESTPLSLDEQEILINYDEQADVSPPTEWLGLYRRSGTAWSQNSEILLCPQRMDRCARGNPAVFHELFSKVVIHELAHALMDYGTENASYAGSRRHFRWVEEGLANFLTLAASSRIAHDSMAFLTELVAAQPSPYRFGGTLFTHLHLPDLARNLMLIDAWRKGKRLHRVDDLDALAATLEGGDLYGGARQLAVMSFGWIHAFAAAESAD